MKSNRRSATAAHEVEDSEAPPESMQPFGYRWRPTSRGQLRTAEILEAALKLLVDEGIEGLTMRRLADSVGMSLSNLQHYFPTRDQILEALTQDMASSYDAAYEQVISARHSAEHRLEAVLTYLMNDIKNPRTERFFTEIWSVATRDERVRELVDRMYAHHRENLAQLIGEINPMLPRRRLAHRACLVAAQIEGMMVLLGANKRKHAELRGVEKECIRSLLALAKAP